MTPAEFDQYREWALGLGLPGVRLRAAGALELSRRTGAEAQQRGSRQLGAAARRMSDVAGLRCAAVSGWCRTSPPGGPCRSSPMSATSSTPDEIWFVEHPPVFTLGIERQPRAFVVAGRYPGGADRPWRSGDVSRPGQLLVYPLSICGVTGWECAVWWWRSRMPSSLCRRVGRDGAGFARGAGGLCGGRQAGERRAYGFAAARVITAWRSMCRWIWRPSSASMSAAIAGFAVTRLADHRALADMGARAPWHRAA